MIGWMMLRGARRATRGGRSSKAKVQAPSWGEINRSRSGQWAIVIFASMFIGAVVLIGWFVTVSANAGS